HMYAIISHQQRQAAQAQGIFAEAACFTAARGADIPVSVRGHPAGLLCACGDAQLQQYFHQLYAGSNLPQSGVVLPAGVCPLFHPGGVPAAP
ncbi:MAG: hypothetical protein LIO58_02860, partial [Oscillospiraceae bacterium]|nr:hypothetical protein [Oscillospiraceae bacterium]